jgi:hypothetical protein
MQQIISFSSLSLETQHVASESEEKEIICCIIDGLYYTLTVVI